VLTRKGGPVCGKEQEAYGAEGGLTVAGSCDWIGA
jgi:hypothetical protein